MLSPFHLAASAVLFLSIAVTPGRTQEPVPAGSDVSIHKVTLENGLSLRVKYYVKGGSPRLQALVRKLQWAENEMAVVEQLQVLKMDTVAAERRVQFLRGVSALAPYGYSPASLPYYYPDGSVSGESSLQTTLSGLLGQEATQDAAMQAIRLLEQAQSELDAELKKLAAKEQQAAKGPVEAVRKAIASLPRPRQAPAPRPALAPRLGLGGNPALIRSTRP